MIRSPRQEEIVTAFDKINLHKIKPGSMVIGDVLAAVNANLSRPGVDWGDLLQAVQEVFREGEDVMADVSADAWRLQNIGIVRGWSACKD